MRTLNPVVLALPFLLLAAGCATDPEFGAVYDQNLTAQVVDMNPKYAGVPMEGSNGERSSAAYRRYLKGNVMPLQIPDGKSVGTKGGGSAPAAAAPPGAQ